MVSLVPELVVGPSMTSQSLQDHECTTWLVWLALRHLCAGVSDFLGVKTQPLPSVLIRLGSARHMVRKAEVGTGNQDRR